MRAAAGVSGSLVVLMIVVAIHYSILSQEVRDREVYRGLNCAFDYCMDKGLKDREAFVQEFAKILNDIMITDGELDIYLVDGGWDKGYVDIVVEETYEYGFWGRKGRNRWERAYRIF